MELTQANRRICQLISRQICGTIDDDEKRELDLWRGESEDNETFYLRMTNPAYMKERAAGDKLFDITLYRKNFEKELGKKLHPGSIPFYKYAAVAAVLVLAVVVISIRFGNTPEVPSIAQAIVPGSNKAILVLDDGRRFDLDDSNMTAIEEKDGIHIASDSNSISYREIDAPSAKNMKNKITVPTAGEYSVELSDGTKVFLNAESELEFPVQFADDRRVVTLKGEAYFEVSASEQWPFIVRSGDVDVLVTGTEFNVKAYPDEDVIQTTLLHGRVSVLSDGGERRVELVPSQQAEWSRSSGDVKVREVDPEMFFAWKNGLFIFPQERLEDIMRVLARWYDIDVIYLHESLKDMRFAGKLDRSQNIDQILNIIRATGKITIVVNGRQIVFGTNDTEY